MKRNAAAALGHLHAASSYLLRSAFTGAPMDKNMTISTLAKTRLVSVQKHMYAPNAVKATDVWGVYKHGANGASDFLGDVSNAELAEVLARALALSRPLTIAYLARGVAGYMASAGTLAMAVNEQAVTVSAIGWGSEIDLRCCDLPPEIAAMAVAEPFGYWLASVAVASGVIAAASAECADKLDSIVRAAESSRMQAGFVVETDQPGFSAPKAAPAALADVPGQASPTGSGSWIWLLPGSKRLKWSERKTRDECEAQVLSAVNRMGMRTAMEAAE